MATKDQEESNMCDGYIYILTVSNFMVHASFQNLSNLIIQCKWMQFIVWKLYPNNIEFKVIRQLAEHVRKPHSGFKKVKFKNKKEESSYIRNGEICTVDK